MFYFFFYFPLGLDVDRRRPAWVTWSLAATAVLGFLVVRVDPTFYWEHARQLVYVPASPSVVALLASAFMHGDWLHLSSNLLALGVFGPALESRLGGWRTAALFCLCHVAGNLVQGALALALGPMAAACGVLGASGAIAGLIGAVLVRLHFARLRVAYWAFMPLQAYTRAGTRTLPVQVAVWLWLLIQAGLALAQSQGGETGIAVGAHLGGLLAGSGLALVLGWRRAAAAEAILRRGRRYLTQASWYPAQGEFLDYVQRCPEDPEGHVELARTLRLTGRGTEADVHYRAACARLAARRNLEGVEAVHAEAVRGNSDFVLEPELQLHLGRMLERSLKPEAAESLYRAHARVYASRHDAPIALFRAYCLATARADPEAASAISRQLVLEFADSQAATLVRASAARRSL